VKLEIRTKQIIKIFENHDKWMGFERLYGRIFKKEYRDSLIVAITFSPQIVIDKYERGTADLTDRINFAKYVQDKGFFVGPRLDPIILDEVGEKWYKKGFDKYLQLIKTLQNQLRSELISDW
jgi:DNA repair photolyase